MRKILLAAICAFVGLVSCAPVYAADKPDLLEVISIDGVIDDGTANQIQRQVEQINENKRVKAVLIVVDSPGGGVLPSAVIYEELSRLKVPAVGFCQNICASGGMYVLMAPTAKYIGVRTSTISGSIGVISHSMRYYRLLDWLKIDAETYKSGSNKDAGNPTRAKEPGEAEGLQAMIDELAGNFYALVGKARPKLTADQWTKIKSADIFFGKRGVEIGLVDAVMSRDEAERKAKSLSGSPFILTRDEMKRLSKDTGDEHSNSVRDMPMPSMFGDVPWLISLAKEIHSGQSMRVEYRLYGF